MEFRRGRIQQRQKPEALVNTVTRTRNPRRSIYVATLVTTLLILCLLRMTTLDPWLITPLWKGATIEVRTGILLWPLIYGGLILLTRHTERIPFKFKGRDADFVMVGSWIVVILSFILGSKAVVLNSISDLSVAVLTSLFALFLMSLVPPLHETVEIIGNFRPREGSKLYKVLKVINGFSPLCIFGIIAADWIGGMQMEDSYMAILFIGFAAGYVLESFIYGPKPDKKKD